MNKCILVGRLTRDPEVRYTQTGKVVASFTLAVDRPVAAGHDKEADFIPIVVWGKVAEIVGNNLTKGRKVLVDGRLQIRSFTGKDGQKRWTTEVIAQTVEFLDGKKAEHPQEQQPTDAGVFGAEVSPEDDIPF